MARSKLGLLALVALAVGLLVVTPAQAATQYATSESGGHIGTPGDGDPLTNQGATGAPDWNPAAPDGTYTQLYAPDTTMTAGFSATCYVGPGADVTVYEAGSRSGISVSVGGVAATAAGEAPYTSSNGGAGTAFSYEVSNVVGFATVTITATDPAPANYAEIDAVECLHTTNPDMAHASGGIWSPVTTYGGRVGKLVYAVDGDVADDGAFGAGSLSINYKNGSKPVTCVFTPDADSSASFVDPTAEGYFSPEDGNALPDSFYLEDWTMTCSNGTTTEDAYIMLFGNDSYASAPRGAIRVLPSLTGCGAFNPTCQGPLSTFEIGSFGTGWPLDTGNVNVTPAPVT